MLSKLIRSIVMAGASALIVTGCYFDDSGSSSNNTTPPAGNGAAPAGSAILGPILGGSASLFNVNANGSSVLPALETVTTDTNGFAFTQVPGGTFRICVTGGTYTDEATGAQNVANGLTLCALAQSTASRIAVSPISTLIDNLTQANLAKIATPSGTDLTDQLTHARNIVQNFYAFQGDPTIAEPLFTAPDTTKDPSGDRYKHAILLGAFSQEVADYLAKCGNQASERDELLKALFEDVKDNVFDGRGLDVGGQVKALLTKCNGGDTGLPLATGTADLLAALTKFGQTTTGTLLQVGANPTVTAAITQGVANGALAPAQIKVAPSQGLIAIDSRNNFAYVPIYTIDAQQNAQVAVVDLTVNAANPIIKVLSLPGSKRPIAATIDPTTNTVYVEAQTPTNTVNVHVIDTITQTVTNTVAATGVTHFGTFGGIIANPTKKKLIVAGEDNVGVMDISTNPPTMVANSVISTGGTDSIALNFDTEILFISSDGSMSAVDTSVNPPVQYSVGMSLGTTDGVAFDTLTNLLVVDPEFQDESHILNFNGATLANSMTLPFVSVPGYGTTAPVGEGPGGQAVVNVIKHQAVVADEFGHNFRLIQLPASSIIGAPNNNGQSGSGTTADAASAFTIASSVLPKPSINGTATQLGILGDPNSLTIDPARNFAYVLADTQAGFHGWTPGSTTPLFLVRIDLSAPLFGTSPTTADVNGNKWSPSMQAIQMP